MESQHIFNIILFPSKLPFTNWKYRHWFTEGHNGKCPCGYPNKDFISKHTSWKNLVREYGTKILFYKVVIVQPLTSWHAWNHSLARVTDATRTFWFLIIQFPKQYSSSSKHLLLFISLFFSDSCWAHWMTLTLQPNPKSKHFTFYIFFFPKTIQSSYYPSHNRFHFRDFLNLFFFFYTS